MTIILATGNKHKIQEFQSILEGKGAKVYAYNDFIESFHIHEHGKDFRENAALKLQAIYQALYERYSQQPHTLLQAPIALLAEDSGLCVQALNGEPGIYSARYAHYKHFVSTAQNSTDEQNLQCLIGQIKHLSTTPAFFIAHIALIVVQHLPLPPLKQCQIEHFEGILHGEVIDEARGEKGFGYDPIFIPNENNPLRKTLAEFEPSAKNAISHRKKALYECCKSLFQKFI